MKFATVMLCFQAEDGIRDWSVTGVQTCALPISFCPGKRGGRASSLFRINGNLGRPRTFRASFALSALHSDTILARRVVTGLSTVPDNAPISKEDKYSRAELRE